jgi:hypothetical protein
VDTRDRRLTAGLETVYAALPCYTTLEQHDRDEHRAPDDHGVAEVIDVEGQEISKPHPVAALPCPTAEDEAALWEKWLPGSSRQRQEKK